MSKRTILVINEGLSQNIGDQAIQVAIEGLLKDRYHTSHAFLSVHKIEKSSPKKTTANSNTRFMPPKMKAHIRWKLLGGRENAKSYYENKIVNADAVIIGGGQLIKNNVSLFCERINLIGEICRKHNKPYGFIGVGVDEYLGILSRARTKKFLKDAKFISVRDDRSRERLQKILGTKTPVEVAPDLAFFLPREKADDKKTHIGINILPYDIFIKSCPDYAHISFDDYSRFWAETARVASSYFDNVSLFTTGSDGDLWCTEKISGIVMEIYGIDLDIYHPGNIDELNNIFDHLSHSIVSRMHAGIIGYTRGVSPLCLNWDDKIIGCWESVGQRERVFSSSFIEAEDGPERICHALRHNIPAIMDDDFPLQIAAATDRCLQSFRL